MDMAKARALFVCLNDSYPQLVISLRTKCSDLVESLGKDHAQIAVDCDSDGLLNATCGWWHIDCNEAKDVKFIFGVFDKKVVSAYEVNVPVESWPIMPHNPPDDPQGGRKYVPPTQIIKSQWGLATRLQPPKLAGPIGYDTVEVDSNGNLT